MQTPNQASVVFRNVESMLCNGVYDETCAMKTNKFHEYVEMFALDNELRLSEVYDMFSTCAPCIQETFLGIKHDNCNVKLMGEVSCGDLSKHVRFATEIFNTTFSPDTSHAFENAYHIANICEACVYYNTCDNDVSEFSETMKTCNDVLDQTHDDCSAGTYYNLDNESDTYQTCVSFGTRCIENGSDDCNKNKGQYCDNKVCMPVENGEICNRGDDESDKECADGLACTPVFEKVANSVKVCRPDANFQQ